MVLTSSKSNARVSARGWFMSDALMRCVLLVGAAPLLDSWRLSRSLEFPNAPYSPSPATHSGFG
jgi:hypothetical protein